YLPDAVPDERGAEHGDVGPGHEHLKDVRGPVHAAGGREAGTHLAVKQRNPAQRDTHGHGSAQQNVGLHFKRLEVDVRLVEAVEQDEPVRARLIQAFGHVGEVGEERAKLYRDGDGDDGLNRLENIEIGLLDLDGAELHVRGDMIDVQLQGIGPGLLNGLGILRPAAHGGPVQARDDWDTHRL